MTNNHQKIITETTRSGDQTIKVNDLYLHSKYDPKKEAISFINSNLPDIERYDSFLVLGLGLGYHVNELANRTSRPILVIEPNGDLLPHAMEVSKIEQIENVDLMINMDVDSLFQEDSFINFLSRKPKTIAHPSSFKLNQKYFESFLGHKSDNNAQEAVDIFSHTLNEQDSKNLSGIWEIPSSVDLGNSTSMTEYKELIAKKKHLSNFDQLILATYSFQK